MGFLIFALCCNLIIPLIMISGGWFMWKHTAERGDGAYGYRSKRSMQSEETWLYANRFCGKLWFRVGLLLVFPAVFSLYPYWGNPQMRAEIISYIMVFMELLQVILLVTTLMMTENRLRRKFE